MSFSVFTSCSINGLPKARALAESLRLHQPNARLTLCLNDVLPDWLDPDAEPFDRVWTPPDLGYDLAWIFQHNTIELCAAVKGRALVRLMEADDAELYLYLAPDVFVLHPLDPVKAYMDDRSIGLLPNVQQPKDIKAGGRRTEIPTIERGVLDTGHLIVRPDRNGRAFASWWADRLDQHCFDDRANGLSVDQQWIDLVPAVFDGVAILRSCNLNVAKWNLAGIRIRKGQSEGRSAFFVDEKPLITYRASGINPMSTHTNLHKASDRSNSSVSAIETLHKVAIGRHGQSDLSNCPSTYDTFEDGTSITHQARKLYRDHSELRKAFANPFEQNAVHLTYQRWLRLSRPDIIDGLCLDANRLQRAFNDLFDQEYYLSTHPDAAAAINVGRYASAVDHYCQVGSRLFLDPNEFFVSSYYHDRACNFDRHILRMSAGTKQGTLLWHYLVSGLQNGIEPIEFFDSKYYLAQNPDVMIAYRLGQISTPLLHFLKRGSDEGRDPGPSFNARAYLDRNPGARGLAAAKDVRGGFGALVRLGGVAGRVTA